MEDYKEVFYPYEGGVDRIDLQDSELERMAKTLNSFNDDSDARIKIIDSKNYKICSDYPYN